MSTPIGATGTVHKPLRADARRNRARVMEVARAAFAECGTDLPMEELARRAGVGIGTVYRHFPNKDALLDALLVEQFAGRIERTLDALDKENAWQGFRELVLRGAEMQAEDIASCEMLMERKAISESEQVVAMREQLEAYMGTLIERAQATGEMRPDFTAGDVPLLFASIAGTIRAVGSDGPWRRQVDFLLDGLRA